ncbi:WD40-repeat-containing domain protein [Boletus reticuloceps]|uniref:WD40-repeat-containing domain protein n=1 Tax=Boletus reticuloceps TaxID=495285 RepID=A0A8I2YCQ6_9AGAM|nr:WD40-repeat-containing domain protein [Boletus reticuloceps]
MPTRPTQFYSKVSVRNNKSSQTTTDQHQHGSLLLDLPKESLTHISSYLPLPSLLALARTCRPLCQHVDDDNTWLRAFLTQFFGIGPEHDLDKKHSLLLRRTENTWRKEFIHRYTTNQRWTSSRSSTVTYEPQESTIDAVHLMSDNALLTSSIQSGIVARSIPFNGKLLKGYLDTSGTGLGIGNPDAEFAPNISACTISSDGGTARVFWGKRNGEVALTVAKRVMDSRAASKFIQCSVDDQHEGAVQQLVADSDSNSFLSAGADGRVKLWDTKTLRLLWSTDKQQLSLVTDPFISITGCLSDGFIAGALKSGDILIYDLHESETPSGGRRVHSMHQLRVSSPMHRVKSQPTVRGDEPLPEPQIAKLWLHRVGDSTVLLLVQYTHHPQFYRVHVDIRSHDVTTTSFGDSSFGNVTALEPVFSTSSRENNMVIVGDLLGFVSIYDVDAPPQAPVAPVHRFEAHSDAVTAISYVPTLLATGTATGTTAIWEPLALEDMCCLSTPAPRPAPGDDWDAVSRILLNEGLVLVVVGNRVMTWKVGSTNGREHRHKKPKHANTKLNVTTKGQQQYEMYKDIAESYMELEYERAHAQRIYGPEREQRSTLNTLGLSESEAVEYMLMLSRDEEEARQQRMVVDEGVFEGDFDDLPGTPPSSRSTPSTPLSPFQSSSTHHVNGRQYPRVSLPISNEKVQVSPPSVPEPIEAGTSISPLTSLAIGTNAQPSPMATRSTSSSSLDHFPAISSSLSSTSSSRRGTSGSPEQPRSAWSIPLKSVSPSPGSSSPRSRVVTPVMTRTRSSNMSLLSADIARHKEASGVEVPDADEMDDDLRLAIELSLAEARSKGESV